MLPCSQCGNTVVVEEGVFFVRCFNCNQMAYATENQLVPYLRLGPQIALSDAANIMQQWMASQASCARLSGVAVLGPPKAYDFLFWSFSGGNAGFDRLTMVPAVNTVLRELRRISLPSHFVSPDMAVEGEAESLSPSVTREAAQAQAGCIEGGVEARLLRVPLYEFPYNYDGRAYRVIIDALGGQCLVDRFPRRPVSLWLMAFIACLVGFGVEGWVLWGNGPWLAFAFVFTALPVAVMTWGQMHRRRREGDR